MERKNGYTTGYLLDYEYFSKHYTLIATDISKQIVLENPDLRQQINFIGRLTRNEDQQCFSSLKNKKKKQLFDFDNIQKWKLKRFKIY